MSSRFQKLAISRQLLLLTVALTLIVFGCLIGVVNHLSRQAAVQQAEQNLKEELSQLSSFLDYTYNTQITTAKRRMGALKKLLPGKLSVSSTGMRTGETDDVPVVRAGGEVLNNNNQLLETLKQINTAEGFILAKKGDAYIRVATLLKDAQGKSQVGKPLAPTEPQVAALNRGEGFIGVVHRNGKSYMSIYEPILDENGKVAGAYGLRSDMEADLTALKQIIKQKKVGETGYFYAFSEAGDDIGLLTIHPSKEGATLKSLFNDQPAALDMFRSVVREKGGTHQYLWPNAAKGGTLEPKLTVFGYSKEWGWYFGAGTFLAELTVEATALRNLLLLALAITAFIISTVITLAISSRLKPLGGIVAGLSAIGEGRLGLSLPNAPEDSKNELDILSNQLNRTTQSIRSLVSAITDTSTQLGSSSLQLDRSSGEVVVAVQEQSDAASSMAASIEEFSVSISQVADLSREASEITQKEQLSADEGVSIVATVKDEMRSIATSVDASSRLVDSLGRRSAEIEGIVRLIQDVAEQTNLLALNAAIEAARAGDTGRGFAVVADEVRKLAERTAKATGEIATVIHGVRSETEQVVGNMRIVAEDVTQGVARVDRAGEALESIRTQSERSAIVVADIANATQEQSVASNQVAQRLESIAQMAEETAAITAQNREAAAHLKTMATELETMVKRFSM